jgi:SAM-dependent methyltransferase
MKEVFYKNYVSSGQSNFQGKTSKSVVNYLKYYYSKFLPQNRNIKIVDIGCGYGRLVGVLHELGYHNTYGIDVSREQIDVGIKLSIKNLECVDFLRGKIQGCYDVFVFHDILEHMTLPEIMKFFERVNSISNHHYMCIIHVPNGSGVLGSSIIYGDITHERGFTESSAKQLGLLLGARKIEVVPDYPAINSVKGILRKFLLKLFYFPFRILSYLEKGSTDILLTQSIYVIYEFNKRD